MSPQQEEDYELVLGNRQLFFLAVVLFGVFFSIGYTVGYSRGRETSDVVATNSAPASDSESTRAAGPPLPSAEPAASSRAKSALYSADPSVSEPASRQPAETPAQPSEPPVRGSSTTSAVKSEPLARNNAPTTPANLTPASAPRSTTAPSVTEGRVTKPAATRAEAPPADSLKPSPSTEPGTATPTVAVAAIEPGTMYLQVLASRDAEPARKSLLEFKSKGHPVTLDNQDPNWYRILVGPFSTRDAADAYQARLQAEGIKSFLRKF